MDVHTRECVSIVIVNLGGDKMVGDFLDCFVYDSYTGKPKGGSLLLLGLVGLGLARLANRSGKGHREQYQQQREQQEKYTEEDYQSLLRRTIEELRG